MHAYLIMAHNDFYILKKLIMMLDDERNDIYIHIDKKAKDFDFDLYRSIAKKSNVVFTKSRNNQWGAYSLVQTEMALFETAYQKKYDYYHLLSGVDLPLKTQDYIHDFFEKNKGCEFVNFVSEEKLKEYKREPRFQYYHIFNQIGLRKKGIGRLNRMSLSIQKKLHVDRYKNKYPYQFGSSWVSLSHKAVGVLVEKKGWIAKHYRYTHCCDEIYKQTVLIQSKKLKKSDFRDNMRLILWGENDNQAHPHTFRIEDFEQLQTTDCLFARKFSTAVDKEIVDTLFDWIQKTTD